MKAECDTETFNPPLYLWTIAVVTPKARATGGVTVLGTAECQDSVKERFSQEITSMSETEQPEWEVRVWLALLHSEIFSRNVLILSVSVIYINCK